METLCSEPGISADRQVELALVLGKRSLPHSSSVRIDFGRCELPGVGGFDFISELAVRSVEDAALFVATRKA